MLSSFASEKAQGKFINSEKQVHWALKEILES